VRNRYSWGKTVLPYRLWKWLAYTRAPGNAFSFWIRQTLRWSRGMPELPEEPKAAIFAYLAAGRDARPDAGTPGGDAAKAAEAREAELRTRYDMDPLWARSTAAIYRKNLYLIDILERAAEGLELPPPGEGPLRALDVGAQDWHYVFGLERWLSRSGVRRAVSLRGIELDGYGIYPDLRSRRDYARAYAAQTGNPEAVYEVGDFMAAAGTNLDVITWFYPFVAPHHLLLWGLPLRHFRPARLIGKAACLLRPGGWLVVLAHTRSEHEAFLDLARAQGNLELVREGEARSPLVDFHADVEERRFSLWRRR
jgi:SAM-dependent methyltransferase